MTSDRWRRCSVATLIREQTLEIGDGYRAKRSELDNEGLPFARAGNINGGFQFDEPELLSWEGVEKAGEKVSRSGDVVFTSKGTVGRFALVRRGVREFVYSPQLCFWRSLDQNKLDSRYLYYWMLGPDFAQQINAVKGQTDMADYVSLRDQRRMSLPLPDVEVQRRIALTLVTLDDKIELNRKMNRTLEEIAQTLFRAWFVNFEGETDLVESEVGLIPRGWEPTTLGDFAENIRNGVDPDEQPPGTPYIGLGHMTPGSITGYSWGRAADVGSTKLAFQEGDLLFGKLRAYFKKVLVAPFEGICSSDILVIRPKHEKWFGLVLGLLTDDRFIEYADGASTGTRMPRVNWKTLARYQVAVPNDLSLVTEYSSLVRTLVARLTNSTFESRTLAEIRDTLLPKLISGEIRVPEAEMVVEEAV